MAALRTFFSYIFFTLIVGTLQAQEVRVLDQATLQPVENVWIYNEAQTMSFHTDHTGTVYLKKIRPQELLSFSHPSYENFFTTLKELKAADYQLRMKEKVILIDELVVSAHRWEQDKKEIPHKIVSIGPKQVEFSNPQTAADMLSETGQVFVQKSQLGGGSPMIRGFAANSVLIVVDGIRLNNAIFRGGNLQNIISIDPLSLESTEVLFGPGSVMYGSDALGGVMHFRTKNPGFISKGETQWNGGSLIRYANANNEKTGHVDLTFRSHKFSNYTSFTFSDFEHLKTGAERDDDFPDFGKRFNYIQRVGDQDILVANSDVDEQIFSGYHQLNLLNKSRLRLGENLDLTYTFNYSTTSDVPRYDRLTETDDQGDFIAAEWFYGPQKWLTNSIQVNGYYKNKLFDAVRLIAGWQVLEESRNDRDIGDNRLRTRTEEVDVVTVNLDLEKKIKPNQELFYGLEWFYNHVTSSGIRRNLLTGDVTPTTPRYPDGGSQYAGLAGYVSHSWSTSDKFRITSGLRYNQIWLNARLRDSGALNFPFEEFQIRNRAVNGNLGFVWTPTDSWQLSLLYSTGFRAPNIDDVGKIFDGSNGIVTVPNPNLRSEFTYNGELSIAKSIEDRLKLTVTGYFTFLDNAIVQDDFSFNGSDSIFFDGEISRVQALVNASSAQIYGASLQLNYALHPNLNFEGNFTFSEGEDSDNRPLRHTTPNFGSFNLTYRYQKLRCALQLRFSGKRTFDELSLGEQQKTHLYTSDGALSWQVLNFRSSYQFTKNVGLSMGIENIFDRHYRPYSSGISAAGRNFIFSLNTRF